MKAPAKIPVPSSPASYFRDAIEKAEADGVARADMLLRLTLSDVHKLKRDPDLAITDISFSGGAMRFLSVKVEQGGVAASTLDYPV